MGQTQSYIIADFQPTLSVQLPACDALRVRSQAGVQSTQDTHEILAATVNAVEELRTVVEQILLRR